MKKIYILILSLLLVILTMSCVSAGWFGWGDDSAEDTDDGFDEITLIKEFTEVDHEIYDDGKEHTYYVVKGVFKGLPNDVEGYTLKTAIYDENGKLIKENDGIYSMKFLADSAKKSEPEMLGSMGIDGFKNVSFYELKIYDPNGEIVFEKNVTFKMENIDTQHKKTSSSSSSSSSRSNEHLYWWSDEPDPVLLMD